MNELGEHSKVTDVWVPGHESIKDKKDGGAYSLDLYHRVKPWKEKSADKALEWWENSSGQRQVKKLFKEYMPNAYWTKAGEL